MNSEGLGLVIQDVNWTLDGGHFVAVVHGKMDADAPLLIMEPNSKKPQIKYIALDTVNEQPLWSPSGDWIAYNSFKDLDAWYRSENVVKITDPAGQLILDTAVADIKGTLDYTWVQP